MEAYEERDDEARRHIPGWLEWVLTIVGAYVLVVAMRAFVLDTYEIPTGSMLETIQLGDRLMGEKVSYYFRGPAVGDIVTFDDPEHADTILIKRVVATAGQVVDIRGGSLYVDGVVQDEPYTDGKPTEPIGRHGSNLSADVSYPHTVGDGCVWVMGDNRTNSLDSRYFGDVRADAVSSRAVFIFWPLSDLRAL